MASQVPTFYNGELYKPECHYMRGPGPAWRDRQRSLKQARQDGSDSRLAVANNEQTRVSPDTLGALFGAK